MKYFITFLEGVVTFISPCLLPMLPIYVSYFTGGGSRDKKTLLSCALGFVAGFTLIFTAMGALASTLGKLLTKYQTITDIICGFAIILFGLEYLGVLRLGIFKGSSGKVNTKNLNFFSSALFGMVFSLGWTPCVGAFLGSALMLSSQQGHILEGITMLLCYSVGLGLPFIISALLIEKLKGAFEFIKRNYKAINVISGCFLIITGLLMALGVLGSFMRRI